ncbi:Hypothetical protein CINCED_3A009041 [Cinara cedri]|uniref:Uncharacterized protein n=1 Tax=Cinara cedri TaxID=506608 RepID=A0A5E4M4F4_9HEMI|nr:Hypothetical protein CINCED_3A009041 [Cinara cedri]
MSLAAVLLVAVACNVYAQVPSSTPCSLSFYRYLYNLPGEQIRPNVPEGTYMFGKRVGPPLPQEGQASDLRPAVLKPASSYEAPLYLPPPSTTTTTTTTTTLKPSTSAPVYIPPPPPPSPIYPAESINNAITVVGPPKPDCDRPEHNHQAPVDGGLLPPYRYQPSVPEYRPQPTIAVPRFTPPPQKPVVIEDNEIFAAGQREQVTVPPPQIIVHHPRPYGKSHEHKNCEKPRPAPTTTTTTTTTTEAPTTTTEAPTTPETVVETRQNEIVIVPEHPDCEHNHKAEEVPQESLGVPSTDYGVVPVQASEQAPSAGYHYDVPSGQPFVYESAAAAIANGYTYPKASPSFEYPSGYSSQGTALFESEYPKSAGAEDGNLIILKV